jgi:glucan 1,3-beta-glucosidase
MLSMFESAKNAGQGKRVIITETGWPSQGGSFKGSLASYENAIRYFIDCQNWCNQNGIESFYFSSFDESWKVVRKAKSEPIGVFGIKMNS